MKIAIYARVSTEKQEEEKTIESQIAELESWVKDQGHTIVERYVDDGYSGTLLARPDLDRLRDDTSKGLFEAVVIHSPDRLARRYVYQEIVIEELKAKGIQLVFLNRRIAETPEDQLLLGVQGVVAEYERAKFVERTRRGRLHRAKSGHILGNIPKYGYDCVKKSESETGYAYYKINKQESRVVKLMFDMLVNQRKTAYAIVRELNRLGIRARKGGRWQRSSVSKVLTDPTYTGTTYYNKHYWIPAKNNGENNGEVKYHRRKNTVLKLRPKEEWIPIPVPNTINKEFFEEAQKQLKINASFVDRHTKLSYLLKGLIKSAKDDRSYWGVPMHGKPHYRCSGKSKMMSDKSCSCPSLSAKYFEPLVWKAVKEYMSEPEQVIKQLKGKQKTVSSEVKNIDNKISIIDKQSLDLAEQEKRFLEAYGSGIITNEQLEEQNKRLQEKREELNQFRSGFFKQKQQPKITKQKEVALKDYLIEFSKELDKVDEDFEEKQNLLRDLLAVIHINGDKVLIKGVLPMGNSKTIGTGSEKIPAYNNQNLASKYLLKTQPLIKRPARCR